MTANDGMSFAEAQEYVNGDAADVWLAVARGQLERFKLGDDNRWRFRVPADA